MRLPARARGLRSRSAAAFAVLALIVAAGLLLRVLHNDYGLPYVYNYDEETHFTSRAVNMFAGTLNPGYFQNPSAFTYGVHLLLRLLYGHWPLVGPILDLPYDTVGQQFALDPTPIWIAARSLAAVLAMAGVVAAFFVGRRLWGVGEGLVAAAVLAFAFLPVAYSRIAVTDAGTLLPVALATFGAIRVYERGGRGDYLLTGAATGLAIGFKYTAGLLLLTLAAATLARLRERHPSVRSPGRLRARVAELGVGATLRRLWDRRRHPEVLSLGLALVAVGAVFFLTTPYFFLKPVRALYELKQQAESAGGTEKLGQSISNGWLFYLRSLTWGLGWAAAAAAAAGAIVLLRRDRVRALLVLLFPVALFLYMGAQSRYFGRWMLPAYPPLALLVGVALTRAVQAIRPIRVRPLAQAAALAVLTLAVLAQPIAADVRTALVLGREDTRNLAREFLVKRFPDKLRVSIEPALPVVPDVYLRRNAPGEGRLVTVCTGLDKAMPAGLDAEDGCLPVGQHRFATGYLEDIRSWVAREEGGATANLSILRPRLIDRYRERGYCVLVTMSTVRNRAVASRDADVLAYYRRLERESDVIYRVDPYDPGAREPPFDFDLSFNYYPTAFERPGPAVTIYRLRDCTQRYDAVPLKPQGMVGLERGIATSFNGR